MSTFLDELVQTYAKTFDDKTFTRSEKQHVKRLLQTYRPSRRERDWLRSHLFDMARDALEAGPSQAILGWLEIANKTLLGKPEGTSDARVYFSPGDACLNAILHQLRSAVSVVKICVFTISDDRISNTILDRHRQGIAVKIVTDNDKLYDLGSDINRLAEAGIAIRIDRTANHMHHKFALFDTKHVLTGSYNWTRSAAERNHENLLISDDKRLVSAYTKTFDTLWDTLKTYA